MHKYRGGPRFPQLFGNNGGYTIVEVMIFLAVSGAIFFSAVLLVSGQQGKTQFQQGVRDVNSKIQNSISEVKTGFYPTGSGAQCTVATASTPFDISVRTPGSSEQGTNQDCVYLGKALHATSDSTNDNNNKLFIYTVLGSRLYRPNPAQSTTAPAQKFEQTSPEPIFDSSAPNVDLTEVYTIPYGVTVKSSNVRTIANPASLQDSSLIGFYQSLENETIDNTTLNANNETVIINGSQSIFSIGYTDTGGAINDNPRSNEVRNCVKTGVNFGTSVNGCTPQKIQIWELCLQSNSSPQTALITVTTTVSGIGTQMEIKEC